MQSGSIGQCWAGAMLVLLAAGSGMAASAPTGQPPLPYYSVELGSAKGARGAAAAMRHFPDVPLLRAEKRAHGYRIRAGAWASQVEAENAAKDFRAHGAKEARVLHMENPAPWLMPDGQLLSATASAVATVPPPAPVAAPTTPATASTVAPPPAVQPPSAPPPAHAVPKVSDDFRVAAQDLDRDVRRVVRTTGFARKDGFTYGLDLGPLLLYAAQRGDTDLYQQVLPTARRLIVDDAHQPFSQGFVLWRFKDGVPAEITGTAEMLWMARALWTGATAFNRPDDRALAKKILKGYAKHGVELQGTWFLRRYFSFADGSFSSISLLPGYGPDFLAEAESQEPAVKGMAEREYGVLGRVTAASGLLYPVIHPELGATYPGLGVDVYAPNGIASLEDSCDAAEGALSGKPKLAQGLLDFIGARRHRDAFGGLYEYYRIDDGEHANPAPLSTTGYACLGLLAAALDDRSAMGVLDPLLTQNLRLMAEIPQAQAAPLYMAGPLLLMANAFGVFSEPRSR